MKKKTNIFIIIILLFFLIQLFSHTNLINTSIINSSKLWFYNLVPSIFPIYIILDLLINYNILDILNFLIKPLTKLFKINKSGSITFILSILSGFPSNSKYIDLMLKNNNINLNLANKLLMFTHFSNPLFIINTIGIKLLNNKLIALVILISHYLGNILIGLINRNYFINNDSNENTFNIQKNNFITTLSNSIFNTTKILFLLYGIITIFMILNNIINIHLNINPIFKAIISSIFEITNGVYNISLLNINIIYKASLITFFLSFGGLCIHMQVFGILNNYKLDYKNYFFTRISHGIITSSFTYFILKLLNVS